MKSYVAVFLLLVSVLAWAAPADKSPQYDITVHVTASRLVLEGDSHFYQQKLNVVIDGKKYELESMTYSNERLMLGDYKARLVSNDHGKGSYDLRQVYEFEFPDSEPGRSWS